MADPHAPETPPLGREADEALALFAQGRLSLTLAAMRAVLATRDAAALAAALGRARAQWGQAIAPLAERLDATAQAQVRSIAAALDHTYRHGEPEAVLARLAAGFDQAAAVSPDAGVALYSLGDPALLAELTGEVVAWLRAHSLVRAGAAMLEVGCGAGRFLQALAGECRLAVGVEISTGMAAEAARRLSQARHVAVVRSSGTNLGFIAGGCMDLVLYADSFPYVVQAGGELPARLLAETARVLAPGGRAVMLNWSYRGDVELDRREAVELAARSGLKVLPFEPPRFAGWDASATVLSRPGPA